MKILPLSEFVNLHNPSIIYNSTFFYISSKTKLIPWYDIFVYYFFIINDKKYLFNFKGFNHVFDDYLLTNYRVTNDNHIDLLNNKLIVNYLNIDNAIFIKIYNNAGHALSIIMNVIYFIKQYNLHDYEVVITQDLVNFSTCLTSIIYMFFEKVHVVNEDTCVNFKTTYVMDFCSFKVYDSCKYFIDILKNKINWNLSYPNFHNICLIKSDITSNSSKNRHFSNDYNIFIKNKGFEIIVPEQFDINTLFKIIYSSKNVILSWGCCSYLNSIFCNENSNVLVICHIAYKHEYDNFNNILSSDWFPYQSNKKLILYDLDTELDETVMKKLDFTINELCDNL